MKAITTLHDLKVQTRAPHSPLYHWRKARGLTCTDVARLAMYYDDGSIKLPALVSFIRCLERGFARVDDSPEPLSSWLEGNLPLLRAITAWGQEHRV